MQHPDQKYIDALLNNDESLLSELYQKFFEKIKRMVVQLSGSETDADDIFQDALLSIYDVAISKKFVLTCPFESFIFLVCKNKWKNELSKRKSHKVTLIESNGYDLFGEDSFKLAEKFLLQQEREDLIFQKLSELGESCRRLLYLNLSGKSLGEVADILKVTYGYVRKRKSECIAKLIMMVKESSKFNSLK